MITVLRGEDVREKTGAGDAALNRSAGSGRLQDLRAARAGELRTNVPDDLEVLGDALEDLTHILPEVPKLAATARAGTILRHGWVRDSLAREPCG
jgi:hypothetical protein